MAVTLGDRLSDRLSDTTPTSPRRAVPQAALKRISVLGATGSVGRSTLDLVARNPHMFAVVALTGNSNPHGLADLAIKHRAALAVVADERHYATLKERLAGTGIEAAAGANGLAQAALRPADCVMAGIVGAAGLRPTLAAVSQGRRLALANKECLVLAGALFMAAVREAGTELLPVDSEHSGVLQAIVGADPEAIERIILTASGGPFRTWTHEELGHATPAQALLHPN
jgi:1-deoxy-D-xylulose-5-phosphate reductoisomerase